MDRMQRQLDQMNSLLIELKGQMAMLLGELKQKCPAQDVRVTDLENEVEYLKITEAERKTREKTIMVFLGVISGAVGSLLTVLFNFLDK